MMRLRGVILLISIIAFSCKSDNPDENATDIIPPDDTIAVTVYDRVAGVVSSNCSDDMLDTLKGIDPVLVREALIAVDAKWKRDSWVSGISHGHRIHATYQTTILKNTKFDYSLFIPEDYQADPALPLPLFVKPAHPTNKLEDDTTLPWLASLADHPFIMITVNFYNRLYLELKEEDYYSGTLSSVRGYHDYFVNLDAAIADVRRKYTIDSDKVYIGGVSAVGNSAWFHSIFSADQYAAINPVSAGTAPFDESLYRNLSNLGILAVHGTEDELVSVELVRSRMEILAAWGFDVEFWEMEGEGHGTMFSSVFPDAVKWMLSRRRQKTPNMVHKAVKDAREASAYWVKITDFTVSLPPDAAIYPDAVPAVLDATWSNGKVHVETQGIKKFELRWMEGSPGPGQGKAGNTIEVVINGINLGFITLEKDARVTVEDYCRCGNLNRLWAGRIILEVP
ncbi:MAG: hypothetical protein ISR82_05550 [Candidatus Marinimicrobia bacterium]|nr:hypothetical protein [Candidatus Neomarinimicrobiota bacterium]MBL7030533.1 hypothetical protein [Candidatus Neomarinimicrobiota bacterium]